MSPAWPKLKIQRELVWHVLPRSKCVSPARHHSSEACDRFIEGPLMLPIHALHAACAALARQSRKVTGPKLFLLRLLPHFFQYFLSIFWKANTESIFSIFYHFLSI